MFSKRIPRSVRRTQRTKPTHYVTTPNYELRMLWLTLGVGVAALIIGAAVALLYASSEDAYIKCRLNHSQSTCVHTLR